MRKIRFKITFFAFFFASASFCGGLDVSLAAEFHAEFPALTLPPPTSKTCNLLFRRSEVLARRKGAQEAPWSGEVGSSLHEALTDPILREDTSVHRFAEVVNDAYFGTASSMSSSSLHSYRIAHDPFLLGLLERSPYWKDGHLNIPDPATAASLFDFVGGSILERVSDLPSGKYILPGLFSKRVDETFAHIWYPGAEPFSRLSASFLSRLPEVDLREWGEIIVHLGILPMGTGFTIRHDFGHLIAALKHPYEELMLQKRFYEVYLHELSELRNEALTEVYDKRMYRAAALIFEDFSLPKLTEARKFFKASSHSLKTEVPDLSGNFGFLEAETLLKSPSPWREELRRFEAAFLNSDERFYSTFETYGGSAYDGYNAIRGQFPLLLSSLDNMGSMEKLYLIYKGTQGSDREEALIRLFAAYYNVYKGELSFESFFKAAVDNSVRDRNGVPIPFGGSAVPAYFRAYCSNWCTEFFLNGLAPKF